MSENTRIEYTVASVGAPVVAEVLQRFGLQLMIQPPMESITGSYWGDPEAGVVETTIYARADTPLHSVLHEAGHVICMDGERRATLNRNAGGDDLEEAAVCYLQVLLGDQFAGVGRDGVMRDMDAWGYSFRLGSTRRWFEQDAQDAANWLIEKGLLDTAFRLTFNVRDGAEV